MRGGAQAAVGGASGRGGAPPARRGGSNGIPWGPLGHTQGGSAPKGPCRSGPSEAGLPPQVGTRPSPPVVPSVAHRSGPLPTRLRVHTGNPRLCPSPPAHSSHLLLHPSHRGFFLPPNSQAHWLLRPLLGQPPPRTRPSGVAGSSHLPWIPPKRCLLRRPLPTTPPQRPPVCPGPGREGVWDVAGAP